MSGMWGVGALGGGDRGQRDEKKLESDAGWCQRATRHLIHGVGTGQSCTYVLVVQ